MRMLSPHESAIPLMDLPYDVTDIDDHRVVMLHRDAPDHPYLSADVADVVRAAPGEIRIDCAVLSHANSVLIAWIIRVVHAAKPGRVALINVHERQAVLFRRMRLDQLVEIR
jgi:hypothetical protein